MAFSLFHRRRNESGSAPLPGTPVIRCSICTGEQVAGFRREDGRFEEVMLLRGPADLEAFRAQYGIQGEIEKIY